MNKAFYKWSPAVPKRRPDNIISSAAREKGLLGFKPNYDNDEHYNMGLLLSMEYRKMWFKERAVYEKYAYTREEIIKQENKIKRRNIQRMMTYRAPTKNQFIDDRAKERAIGDKSIKTPPYTRNYRFFKYKPDCSGIAEEQNKDGLSIIETTKSKVNKKETKANENLTNAINDNVIEAELVYHGNCKCHPNA